MAEEYNNRPVLCTKCKTELIRKKRPETLGEEWTCPEHGETKEGFILVPAYFNK